MNDHALVRQQLRPHGIVAPGCYECPLFKECGGIEPEKSLLDCFALSCCGHGQCDNVCLHKSDFMERMTEIGGIRFDDLPVIRQQSVQLPKYVPLIQHGSSRTSLLNWPVVALDPFRLLRQVRGSYQTVVQSPAELRSMFKLRPETKIILRATNRDPSLETYWAYHRSDQIAQQFAALGIEMVIGPNFSHFLDVPRTDNLFNRKRQLICLVEMCQAGLTPIPHLSAAMPGDWRFWRKYLLLNEKVNVVAIEFQTGNKRKDQGAKVIHWVAWLQQEIGRPLHLIAIGAAQFLPQIAARLDAFTILDSMPFMQAAHRRLFELFNGRATWTPALRLPIVGIDEHLEQNIERYSAWIECRAKMKPSRSPSHSVRGAPDPH